MSPAARERSFDELASGLASENISRRRAIKLAGASLLGAAGLLGSANAAQAVPTCPPQWATHQQLQKALHEHQQKMLLHQDGFGQQALCAWLL